MKKLIKRVVCLVMAISMVMSSFVFALEEGNNTKEPAQEETAKVETAKEESPKESSKEEAKESSAKEEPSKEESKEAPAKEESSKEEPKEAPAKVESSKEDPKDEPVKEEPSKEESSKEEPAKEESASDETLEEESAKKGGDSNIVNDSSNEEEQEEEKKQEEPKPEEQKSDIVVESESSGMTLNIDGKSDIQIIEIKENNGAPAGDTDYSGNAAPSGDKVENSPKNSIIEIRPVDSDSSSSGEKATSGDESTSIIVIPPSVDEDTSSGEAIASGDNIILEDEVLPFDAKNASSGDVSIIEARPTRSGDMICEKAEVWLMIPTVEDLKYNGTVQNPEIKGFDNTKMKIAEESVTEAKDVGAYAITFELLDPDGPYVWLFDDDSTSTDPVSVGWEIEKGECNVTLDPQKKIFEYTGEEICIVEYISGITDNIIISGDIAATDVGVYDIIISLKDDENYTWADGTVEPFYETWEIVRRVCWSYEDSQRKVYKYDGEPHIWRDKRIQRDDNIIVGGVTSATDAGVYRITLELDDKDNYTWEDGTTANKYIYWEITPAVCWSYRDSQKRIYTYDGTTMQWFGDEDFDDTNIIVSGDVSAKDVGEYEVILSLDDDENYTWEDGTTDPVSIFWSIEPAVCWSYRESQGRIYTYKGWNIYWNNYGELENSNIIVSGDKYAVDAGQYEAILSLADDTNYTWEDGTTDPISIYWEIEPAVCWAYIRPQRRLYLYTGDEVEFEYEIVADRYGVTEAGGDLSATEPGKYYATLSLIDKDNYVWSNDSTQDKQYYWEILDMVQGDMDDDKDVTIKDVKLMLQRYINMSDDDYLTEEEKLLLDINGDGILSIVDVRLLLLRYISL